MQNKFNILILEDNPDDLELLLLELKKGAFEFSHVHASDKETFEKALSAFKPDIIISDHNLPSYTSLEALITARSKYPDIPFILVSGFIGEDEAINLIVNKDVNDFLLKDNLIRLNSSIIREVKGYYLREELKFKNQELNMLSMVAKQTLSGVIITDAKGKVEWVNNSFTKITGYTLKDLHGKKPGDILQGKGTNTDVVNRISEKLKNQIPFQEEILNYKKTGEEYWIKLDISPLFDADGNLTKFVAIQDEITEEKHHQLLMLAINDITTSLLDSDSFTEICNTITEKLIHHFGFEDCVIYEADQKNKKLIQIAATGDKVSDEEGLLNPLILDYGEGIVGSVAQNKKAEIVSDTTKDNRYVIDNAKRNSELAVPIILDNELLGVIDTEHPDKNFYNEEHLLQLKTVAGVIASKFKAAQENRLKKKAEEDFGVQFFYPDVSAFQAAVQPMYNELKAEPEKYAVYEAIKAVK